MDSQNRINETEKVIMSFFSSGFVEEATRILRLKKGTFGDLEEIRLRSEGVSSLVLGGHCVMLSYSVSRDEMRMIVKRVCDMAVFAHRDDICRGFVSMEGGIRVGIGGHARYDGGKIVGVSDISTLVFRIPRSDSSVANQLFDLWNNHDRCGMLVCSRAGEGKTTALRAMARIIGGRPNFKRVAVVDERCEFDPSLYRECTVDILRGYKRALGVDIAIRTISADVIIVDEIGLEEDADAMISAIGAGIPVIATAHGKNIEEVLQRPYIRRLVDNGLFGIYALIFRRDKSFSLEAGEFKRGKPLGAC